MIAFERPYLRVGILAVVFGLVLAVVLKVLLSPPVSQENLLRLNTFKYPEKVELKGWELTKSTPIVIPTKEKSTLNNGHKYEYTADNLKLEVEAYYQTYNGGNTSRLLSLYKNIRTQAAITGFDYLEGTGFYASFVDSQRMNISACVNPYGQTTVTEQQHAINRYKHGLNLPRTLGWIFGQGELVDAGCLWTFMSLPLSNNSGSIPLQQAREKVQAAWVDWTLWWTSRLTSSGLS